MSAPRNKPKDLTLLRGRSGFTLVELLVVISIIAILSVIGITVFSGVQKSARDARRRGDLDAITKAFEVKYSNTGTYGDLSPGNNGNLFSSGTFPTPPEGGQYTIIQDATTKGFKVCAALQDNPPCSNPSSNCSCKSSQQADPPGSFNIAVITNPDSLGDVVSSISGLQLWLKANALNLSNNSVVSSWADQSGKGNNATTVNNPTFQTNAINGMPVIRFSTSPTNQTFQVTTNFPPPYTVLYVARQNGPTRGRLLSGFGNNWLLGWWCGSKSQGYFEGWVAGNGSCGISPTDSNVYLYTVVGTGSLSTVFENGRQIASNGNGVAGPNGLTLGINNSEFSDADIAEIIVYSKALSPDERHQVESYLAQKYGISLQP